MSIRITFRIEDNLYLEISNLSKTKNTTLTHALIELLELGFQKKKELECTNLTENSTNKHIETGASAAIETLLLLRKTLKETHTEWIETAHTELLEYLKK